MAVNSMQSMNQPQANQSSGQGMDVLTSAMSSNLIPDQEYLLQGSVFDTSLEVLKHRLRGLCDTSEYGDETFNERELVFSIQGSGPQPLNLRVRRPNDLGAEGPWQLRYLGQPEIGNRPTLVRSCYDIACSENAVEFLSELGCTLQFEYVAKGFIYRKGRIKITISRIFKVPQNGGPESSEPLTQSHLVEMSVLAPSGSDVFSEEMKNFADQLRPIVALDKGDPKRMMSGGFN